MHQNISFKRAFNPIIGETYQGYFCFDNPEAVSETPDHGFSKKPSRLQKIKTKKLRQTSQPTNAKSKFINIFAEQISHHPPIVSLLMIGRGFKIYGNFEAKVEIHINTANGSNDGVVSIHYDDGQLIKFTNPKG